MKRLIFALTMLTICVIGLTLINFVNDDEIIAFADDIYTDRVSQYVENGIVTQFVFNPNYKDASGYAKQYNWYQTYLSKNGNPVIFYRDKYLKNYIIYTWIHPSVTYDIQHFNFSYLMENQQKNYGGANYLYDANYNLNLKTGSTFSNFNSGYNGYNSGHMIMPSGLFNGRDAELVGKKFEWRFLSYSAGGTAVGNPYFPPDVPSSSDRQAWEYTDYIKNFWTIDSLWDESPYSPSNMERKGLTEELQRWFYDYLFACDWPITRASGKIEYIGEEFLKRALREKDENGNPYTYDTAWLYWVDKLMWETDPTQGNGLLILWHGGGPGTRYYRSILLPYEGSTAESNIKMTNLKLIDQKTGNVISEATRAMTEETTAFTTVKSGTVNKGETYTLEATYVNTSNKWATVTTPNVTQYAIGVDTKVTTNTEMPNPIYVTGSADAIPPEGSLTFTWEYTIDSNMKNYLDIQATVPGEYALNGDNNNRQDDTLIIEVSKQSEDMSLSDADLVLIDALGNETTKIIPGQPYKLGVYIHKVQGSSSVGGSENNPYATVDIAYFDGLTKEYITDQRATKVLDLGKSVYIETGYQIVPQTAFLRVYAEIDKIHSELGYNDNPANDNGVRTYQSQVNIAVSNFSADPSIIYRESGKPAGTENMTFNASITYETSEGTSPTAVTVNLYHGSTLIKSGPVTLNPNTITNLTWTVNNVPLNYGTEGFTITANLNPTTVIEILNGVSDPYTDNSATDTVSVKQMSPEYACISDGGNTKNTWVTTYTTYHWAGVWKTGQNCWWGIDSEGNIVGGCVPYAYCEQTSWTTSSTVSHYETFEITHVYFRSKLTKDVNPTGTGWVELKGGNPGKIKAGYSFELQIVTEYKTNAWSAAPNQYDYNLGCTGGAQTSPAASNPVAAPNSISIEIEGVMTQKITGTTVYKGSWENQETTYIPAKIQVPENVKNGDYTLNIVTQPYFYGATNKPYVRYLQDCLQDSDALIIRIVGSNADDVNTHIIQ